MSLFIHFPDDYDPNEKRDPGGKWTTGSGGGSKQQTPQTYASVFSAAKKYLPPALLDKTPIGPKKFANPKVMGSSTPYGINLNPDFVAKAHPAYVAGIIYHEMIHQGQDERGLKGLEAREHDAHSKTAAWAQRKLANSTDKKEKQALERLLRESQTMADTFGKGARPSGYKEV